MSDEPPPRPDAPERRPASDRVRGEPARGARSGVGPEEVPYIDDPWTKVFVGVVIVVFVAIFLNAFLLGKGGLLTRTPSPSPAPSATPTEVPSPTSSATSSPVVSLVPTTPVSPSATP